MKTFALTTLCLTAMLAAISQMGIAAPTSSQAIVDAAAIQIRDRQATPPQSSNGKLVNLTVTPSKKSYRVGEPIRFKVSAPEAYHLYVFNIDNATGESVLLIPNNKTRSNYLSAKKVYDIPGTVDFYSDSVGKEQMVFVASKEPIDLSRVTKQAMGAFSISKTADLQDAFAAKAIQIRDPQATPNTGSNNQAGVVTLELNITR